MRVVCLSDTHHLFHKVQVPDGDLLLHAGDLSHHGTAAEVRATADWLRSLPHRHKVVIGGNHDFCLAEEARSDLFDGLHYLQDQALEVEGLRLYGSPWTPKFGNWVFQTPRTDKAAPIWARIPDDTQLLLTHGPPAGIGDLTLQAIQAGCEALNQRVRQVRPLLHLFGHIHEGYGVRERDGTTFVNGACCAVGYLYQQKPHVFDWDGERFHPVTHWTAGEHLWNFLVERCGKPTPIPEADWKGELEMGHAFCVDTSNPVLRFFPARKGDHYPSTPEKRPYSFGTKLQLYWFNLLNDHPWSDRESVPGL